MFKWRHEPASLTTEAYNRHRRSPSGVGLIRQPGSHPGPFIKVGDSCESMADEKELLQRILAALGRLQDRLKTSEDRITAIEQSLDAANEPATKEEVVLIRESLIETRAALEDTADVMLTKPPVALPKPGPFDTTLEDF